jgi:hypothetical protein
MVHLSENNISHIRTYMCYQIHIFKINDSEDKFI